MLASGRLSERSFRRYLRVASLAREMGIDRGTVYYHFKTREALIAAATAWSSEQLAKAFLPMASRAERID